MSIFFVRAQAQEFDALKYEFDNSTVLKGYFYGFNLYDLDQNRFLFGTQEDKYFTPASNTKVFTLFTTLKNIGDSIPGLQYVTRGDSLIFWGTGDPTFLHSKLDSRKVYNLLKQTDKKLFYVEEKSVEEPFYRNGWAIEDFEEYYQPELSSFPIYGNVVTFREKAGRLVTEPSFFNAQISVKEQQGKKFNLTRSFDANLFYMNSTRVPNNYVNEKPFRYSPSFFVELLQDTLHKTVERIQYQKPKDITVLYSIDTKTVLREMMLPSDNFLAEQLTMVAAMEKFGSFRTAELRKYMMDTYYHYFTDKIDLNDGSGLSAYNKVTPRSMVELLLLVQAELTNPDDLHHVFPTGGVDGTIKSAYSLDRGEPFVWAKTGTITSVHCQSGFIKTRSGRNLVFSFMNNNFIGSASPVRKEMVRLITFIRQNY